MLPITRNLFVLVIEKALNLRMDVQDPVINICVIFECPTVSIASSGCAVSRNHTEHESFPKQTSNKADVSWHTICSAG